VDREERMARIDHLTKVIKLRRTEAKEASEERRLLILELAAEDVSDAEIARAAGLTRQAVNSIRTGKRYNPHGRRK
jgi:hypothetical protein